MTTIDKIPRTNIHAFALENAAFDHIEMQTRIADLEGERDTYRDMLRDALATVHAQIGRLENERRQRLHLIEEFRSFRRRVMDTTTTRTPPTAPRRPAGRTGRPVLPSERSWRWRELASPNPRISSPALSRRPDPPRPQA